MFDAFAAFVVGFAEADRQGCTAFVLGCIHKRWRCSGLTAVVPYTILRLRGMSLDFAGVMHFAEVGWFSYTEGYQLGMLM